MEENKIELPVDMDGEQIKPGDTVWIVWGEGEPTKRKVKSLVYMGEEENPWYVRFAPGFGDCVPAYLTHKDPSTLETIKEGIYHLVMAEYLDDPEGEVENIVKRIEKLIESNKSENQDD